MHIQQLYTGCLSEAAYYVESGGEAAIIDPLRDTDAYVELARERGATIRYIFETHFHADFVSGHLDLAARTGAPIVYGPRTETAFPIHLAGNGEEFSIGRLTMQVIHTPGHTLESTCYLLKDEEGAPYCLFTGDTLFVGDVGRPDLSSGDLSKEALAGHLYDSLQILKQLPDHVLIYPAHGPGSSCGKNIGKETVSTIGEQKKTNYAMLATNKDDFIREVTSGLEPPPAYFFTDARINREGYEPLDEVMRKSLVPLSPAAFKEKMAEGAWVLDTRSAADFTEGFVPGAINIGLQGRFAEWTGILIPFHQQVILVTDPGQEEDAIVRMSRVGFDHVEGYLEGGLAAWRAAGEQTDLIVNIEPDELALDMPYDKHLVIVDVRRPPEFGEKHVRGAVNIPLETMSDPGALAELEDDDNLYLHCQSGYRSAIACSILKKHGFHNIRNVLGGMSRMENTPGIATAGEENVLN